MKNRKKELVKYDNHFNLTNLNTLNQIEMDVFFACISEFTKTKKLEVAIPFGELRRITFLDVKEISYDKSLKRFESLGKKVINMQFWVRENGVLRGMPLFMMFTADFNTEQMSIKMNPAFAHYFFDIPEKIGFSQFELEPFIFLKSKYSKTLFRHLLQHFTGKWTVDFKEFRELMGFPESYKTGEIKKTLDRAIPELVETGYFDDIEYDWTYSRRQGRPIKDIILTYKANQYKALERAGQTTIADYDYSIQTEPKTQIEVDTSDPLRPVATEKTVEIERKCPYCGEGNIISRTATGEKNKGRRYEKCEYNDGKEWCCKYFKWLDEN